MGPSFSLVDRRVPWFRGDQLFLYRKQYFICNRLVISSHWEGLFQLNVQSAKSSQANRLLHTPYVFLCHGDTP